MPTKNKLSDLRDHLFAALEGLSDKDKPMEIERAQATANVAREIINSAKVELQFLKMVSATSDSMDPLQTAKFFKEEADPRCNPRAALPAASGNGKSLNTGKHLGGRSS